MPENTPVRSSPYQASPAESQARIFASLPADQQQALAESLIEEMRHSIRQAILLFERKTGMVVCALPYRREVAFCGFPQPVIDADACSIKEYEKSDAYREAKSRSFGTTGPGFTGDGYTAEDCRKRGMFMFGGEKNA